MVSEIEVETQGVSDDWTRANGDFDVKARGLLNARQMLSAMLHLSQLDTPEGDDACAPQLITRAHQGAFSFIGQGGTIFCPETDSELTAPQATDMAFGKRGFAPPPPMPAAPQAAPVNSRSSVASRTVQKRKFGFASMFVMFLSLCFIAGAVVMVFGVSSMQDRGASHDDIMAAMTMSGAFALIGVLAFFLALKARRTHYYDASGTRVKEDGSALPFVVMADSFTDYDSGDDGFDGDFD